MGGPSTLGGMANQPTLQDLTQVVLFVMGKENGHILVPSVASRRSTFHSSTAYSNQLVWDKFSEIAVTGTTRQAVDNTG